jgi:hypothetical protein
VPVGPSGNLHKFKIVGTYNAKYYPIEFLKSPENRSMDKINEFAHKHIEDKDLRTIFANMGKEMLDKDDWP